MRMIQYFAIATILVAPALIVTAILGALGKTSLHFNVGLISAIAAVGLHTLLILFMIVTGRVLKEATRARDLSPEFLGELNQFFAKKAAYPAAVFSAVAIVTAGVLAYGAPAMGLPPALHWIAGVIALVLNLWAIPVEMSALRSNQNLLDRAARELDEIDREMTARGEPPVADPPLDARHMARAAMIVAISVWMPYLYWALVVWRGDFSKTSLHPWIEISVVALFIWWLAKREADENDRAGGDARA